MAVDFDELEFVELPPLPPPLDPPDVLEPLLDDEQAPTATKPAGPATCDQSLRLDDGQAVFMVMTQSLPPPVMYQVPAPD